MSLIKSLSSIAKPSEDQNIARFGIYDYAPPGQNPSNSGLINKLVLQYYPDSISVDRNAEYATKKPLGGSHPLYQWVHGSERSLSIEAIFTAEQDVWPIGDPAQVSTVQDVAQSVSNYIKNPATAAINSVRGGVKNPNKFHVDVPSAIQWLQSKTYPLYTKNSPAKPPPKLILVIPNAGITTHINGATVEGYFYCLMTKCSVKLTSFFKSGAPRIAEVSLSFEEIIQIGSQWGYVSRDTFKYLPDESKGPTGGGYGLMRPASAPESRSPINKSS